MCIRDRFNPFYTDDYIFDVEKKDSIKTLLLTLWKSEDDKVTKTESGELELFHAYQYRKEKNITSFCNAKMNYGIEAHFAHYCYLLKSEDDAPGWSFAAEHADNRGIAIQMLSLIHI